MNTTVEEPPSTYLNILIIVALLVLNALFVAVEYAIRTSSALKLKNSEQKKKRGARAGIWLIGKLDLSLSATQIGVTLSSLLLGWFGIQTFRGPFSDTLGYLGAKNPVIISSGSALLAVLLLAYLHIVFGELIAKALAMRFPELTLRILARPVVLVTQICRPVLVLITTTTNLVLRLFRTSLPSRVDRFHSASELTMLVSQSTERGVFDKDEEKMLRGVFGFSDTIAREVMTPRTDLVAIDVSASFEQVLQTVVETGLSRFPVKNEEIDDIIGIFLVKDFLPHVPIGSSAPPADFSLRKLMRDPYFIPGTKPIDDLLNEFKRQKIHMAIVLDEHGGVDGLVTLEDLIEEIVGDIFDEMDVLEHSVVLKENGEIVADGGTLVCDLNERFSLSIPEGDYDTIAGFIFTSLGRMTTTRDEVIITRSGNILASIKPGSDMFRRVSPEFNGGASEYHRSELESDSEDPLAAIIRVERVENHRIEQISISRPANTEDPEPSGNSEASENAGIVHEE